MIHELSGLLPHSGLSAVVLASWFGNYNNFKTHEQSSEEPTTGASAEGVGVVFALISSGIVSEYL